MNPIATLSTSRTLTIMGIGTLLITFGNAVVQFTQGGFSSVDLKVLIGGLILGFGQIFSKGANSTGTATPPAPPAP
jgi:hypothetical protein